MRDVAHAQDLPPSPTLVDTVVVNAGLGTIIVSMGTYVGGFALPKDNKKGAILYRWALAPPVAPLLDLSVAEAAGWLIVAKKARFWLCRCTEVHPPPSSRLRDACTQVVLQKTQTGK